MDKLQQYKAKAKVLFTYLKEIGKPVARGQTLDAMARLEGCRDWNVLVAQARTKNPATDESRPTAARVEPEKEVKLVVEEQGRRVELEIKALVYPDDHAETVQFVANDWFVQASDDELRKLAFTGFSRDYPADAVAEYFIDRCTEIKELFDYVHAVHRVREMGFECEVVAEDAWKYMRAFRYPVFVQAACEELFGTCMHEKGWGVFANEQKPGTFYVRTPDGTFDRNTEEEAWTTLGEELESLLANEPPFSRVVHVRPGSGVLESPSAPATKVAGRLLPDDAGEPLLLKRAPLNFRDLARITENGKYGLDVVVPVGLNSLVDFDIEWLNDEVSERITGSIAGLVSLVYSVYRGAWPSEPSADVVLLRVRAWWEPSGDNEAEDEDEDEDEGNS